MCRGAGVLAALVLRAEWGLAQKAAKARAEVLPTEKEPLVESIDVGEDIPILTSPHSEKSPLEIRVPAVNPFNLHKTSFHTPVFNILMATTLLCHLPAVLLSIPAIGAPITATYPWTCLALLLPGQTWTLFVNPIVLGLVLWIRKDNDGREIWNYGERWTKEEPMEARRVLSEAEVKRVVEELVPRANGDEKVLSESELKSVVDVLVSRA